MIVKSQLIFILGFSSVAMAFQKPPADLQYNFKTIVSVVCSDTNEVKEVGGFDNQDIVSLQLNFLNHNEEIKEIEVLNIDNGGYRDQKKHIQLNKETNVISLRNSLDDKFTPFGTIDPQVYVDFCSQNKSRAEYTCRFSEVFDECVAMYTQGYRRFEAEVTPLPQVKISLFRDNSRCSIFKKFAVGTYERHLKYYMAIKGEHGSAQMGPLRTTELYEERSRCTNYEDQDGWK